MPIDDNRTRETEKLQDAQHRLVAEGMKIPGVAEVIAVYGALAPYAAWRWGASAHIQHATGGNLENENNEVGFA